MTIVQQEIKERLINQYDYREREASTTAAQLSSLQPPLQESFRQWWETDELPELNVEGYTVQQLINSRGMTAPAAILVLDWLIRQPDAARAALQEPVDYIEFSHEEE